MDDGWLLDVLIRPWAPSRAVAISCVSSASTPMDEVSAGVDVVMGFASWANRRPRSNVYGVGRSTTTSSFAFDLIVGADIVM